MAIICIDCEISLTTQKVVTAASRITLHLNHLMVVFLFQAQVYARILQTASHTNLPFPLMTTRQTTKKFQHACTIITLYSVVRLEFTHQFNEQRKYFVGVFCLISRSFVSSSSARVKSIHWPLVSDLLHLIQLKGNRTEYPFSLNKINITNCSVLLVALSGVIVPVGRSELTKLLN